MRISLVAVVVLSLMSAGSVVRGESERQAAPVAEEYQLFKGTWDRTDGQPLQSSDAVYAAAFLGPTVAVSQAATAAPRTHRRFVYRHWTRHHGMVNRWTVRVAER